MIPFLELKSQFQAIEPEIRAAIDRVLARGWYVLGEECAAFEREFGAYLGVDHAVGVNSGTDAIGLALRALGVGPGDEVITAANTCVPTAVGIVSSGATLALADVSPRTLTIDVESVAAAITPKTRAVVPVHLYGHPCDMGPLLKLARTRGLAVVEDCAQAHGARYHGKPCGTFGDAAAFSFYPSKNLGAYGDGGAVVTRDAEVAERLRRLRNYGQADRYHHVVEGVNSRLDEMQAAILRAKLPHLDAWNAARRERALLYMELFQHFDVQIPKIGWAEPAWHLLVIRTAEREALREHLKARDIGTEIHYPVPLHLQPCYAHLGYRAGQFPAAERACGQVLSLPLYPELSLDAVRTVAAAVEYFLR
jgi:dTDP-4-amino-4,6-dideoxygalactose transaminase